MEIVMNVVCIFLGTIALVIIPLVMLFGIPKICDWYSLNLSTDYLENRAYKKVGDLQKQVRVIELEKQAIELQKKLEEAKK